VLPGVIVLTAPQERTLHRTATRTAIVQAAPQDNTQALVAPAIVQTAHLVKAHPVATAVASAATPAST
jgi:hypothetical protein